MEVTRFTRRRALGLAVGAAVVGASRGAEGRLPEMPRTVAACVASMETLISLDAIDRISALSEARRFEYRRGLDHIKNVRWNGGRLSVAGPLKAECAAVGIGEDELIDYLISAIAWRRRGRQLDVAAQLAPFREARRREGERARKAEEANKRAGVRVFSCHVDILSFVDPVYFGRDAATPSPGQETPMDGIARMLVESPDMAHVEVQAHAASGERSPGDLSRVRAVAVVEALVHLGVPSERLTAHGLSTRFPNRRPEKKPKDLAGDADARAELFLLRRIEAT